MKLDELSLDSKISINVSKGGKGATFFAKPEFAMDGALYVAPIMHGEKMIDFSIPDLKIELVATKNGELPSRFKNIRITPEKVRGRVYHCISTKTTGARSNRRVSNRVPVGEMGKIIEDLNGAKFEALIKDVSESGIGFILDPKIREYKVGERLRIYYVDPTNFVTVDVNVRVARTEETPKGRLYGCNFTRNYPQIVRYVALKAAHAKKRISIY